MTSARGTLGGALVGLLLGSALMAGCGTQRPPTTMAPASSTGAPPTSSAVAATPSANDFVASVMLTRGLATAMLRVTVRTDVSGASRVLTGAGAAAVAQGYGDLVWTDASGSRTRELSNGRGLYVQTDMPDGMWMLLPDERSTPTSRLADPLRGLGQAQNVTRIGPEELDGVSSTRFAGTLPASPEQLALLGFSDEELVVIGSDWEGGTVRVDVWIDDRGRVVGVERALELPDAEAGPVQARTMTLLSDFTAAIDLESPPSQSVVEAPEAQ